MSSLTFRGAIGYTSASITVHSFAAFHSKEIALRIEAPTHLCHALHFFIFLIKATTGDALPEEFYKRVQIGWVVSTLFIE
mmetsp:Transcript_10990/g.16208  ORF Transcript_10990/g.16208 Transcript_10990/m.16208 type:complete len:80 (-) Transcript_10990:215-454(-)